MLSYRANDVVPAAQMKLRVIRANDVAPAAQMKKPPEGAKGAPAKSVDFVGEKPERRSE